MQVDEEEIGDTVFELEAHHAMATRKRGRNGGEPPSSHIENHKYINELKDQQNAEDDHNNNGVEESSTAKQILMNNGTSGLATTTAGEETNSTTYPGANVKVK